MLTYKSNLNNFLKIIEYLGCLKQETNNQSISFCFRWFWLSGSEKSEDSCYNDSETIESCY